ncbi:DUF1003 domain-containing protein [Actinoallomurus purpureus]|uniref:DUF1003 domain-containing protein n=1 Tax=Actinoallomurus purpureus TaxID=478114 RepID=UPI002092F8BD|nr:DUF1003 domain-containing protein [Actinoallomurus purpureus]MCO6010788.1 DUF1003 domain-containing protein [Actinoallomurus purpureus]
MGRPRVPSDRRTRHPANVAHFDHAPLGARIADAVARRVGSWRFIGAQTAVVACWVAYNAAGGHVFDPWPFIALNLALSMEAAYTGPILQLSQNRQTAHAEARADTDHEHGRETHAMLLALIRTIEEAKSMEEIHQIDWRGLLDQDDLGAAG